MCNEAVLAAVDCGDNGVPQLEVGRNVDEVLRVLDALQSEEVCACSGEAHDPSKNITKLDGVQSALSG